MHRFRHRPHRGLNSGRHRRGMAQTPGHVFRAQAKEFSCRDGATKGAQGSRRMKTAEVMVGCDRQR